MYKKLAIRKRVQRQKRGPLDLDITSLLDIIVILVFFLLKNYNATGVSINVAKDIKLPWSETRTEGNTSINIQVSPTSIWVDEIEIVKDIRDPKKREFSPNFLDSNGKTIIPLYNELIKKKETIELIAKSAPNAKPFSGSVNLIMDKSLNFDFVKNILFTCGEAGFKQFKFVVLSKNE